jgi:hypothetical protein
MLADSVNCRLQAVEGDTDRAACGRRGGYYFGELRAQQTSIGAREEQRDTEALASQLIALAAGMRSMIPCKRRWRRS